VPGRATVAPLPDRDNVPGVLPRAGEIPIHSPPNSAKELEKVQEALANVMLFLVALHVLGIIAASVERGENITK